MTKLRLAVTFLTLLVLATFGSLAILYARGYRFGVKEKSLTLNPKGLLSITSDPSGAQVFIDGKLETATDNTISLSPGKYTVRVQKDGFLSWEKQLLIEKEIVTQSHAFLIPQAPSLTAFTFSGSLNPQFTSDFSKIAFVIPPNTENGIELSPEGSTKAGLWIIETTNLPLGFNRDPRQITDGDLTNASWQWSPDGREILLKLNEKSYMLDTSKFTSQLNRVPISNEKETLETWMEKNKKVLSSQLSNLPKELQDIFENKTTNIHFSPDGDKILYTTTVDTNIPEGLIKELPGASTQTQERNIKKDNIYVYDTKEDRNFLVGKDQETVYWLPNSHNLLIPRQNQIQISDYDGTNIKTAFSGGYIYPYAFPSNNTDKILILTSLGASSQTPNLYWLSLK